MSSVAVDFLERLRPGGPWTLSACTPDREKMETRTFVDSMQAQRWIAAWNGERNLYFSVNPGRDKEARKKFGKTDIESVTHLHVDLDPRKGEAADEAFRTRALHELQQFNPAPTAIVYSGGGFNALWHLKWPVELDGTQEAAENIERWNIGIAQQLGADNCHNIDRILRLPGTWNIPGEQKRAKGREKTMSALVSFKPEHSYTLEPFKVGVPKQANLEVESDPISGPIKSLDELAKYKLPDRVKTVIALGHDPDNPKTTGDTSRSAWLFDGVCQLIRFGVPDSIIYSLITDPGWGISESVLDKKARKETYAKKQIRDAHNFAVTGEHTPKDPPSLAATDVSEFQKNDEGKIYCNQHNIDVAFKKLGIELSYDVFAERMQIEGLPGFGPTLQDEAVTRMYLTIEQRFKFRPSKDYFQSVVEDRARYNTFHPVVDYLAALEWDRTPRIDKWLITYAGAFDTEYTRAVSKLMLLGAVRRVRDPGCKFDEMCVLISPTQGTGKSSALKALCPREEWFTDDIPLGADSKVIIERLAGKWICEAAELKGMRKSDVEHLKAFLSRAVEQARMAWGRIAREFKRQNVFFGTTNALRFLQDMTGNRRFWPILIQALDAPGIMRDRNQLWAEAAHREAQGESTRLEERLWAAAAEQQDHHRVDDPIYDALVAVLGESGDPEAIYGCLTTNDVWDIIDTPVERRQNLAAQVGEVMRKLGFQRDRRVAKMTGRREYMYQRGASEEELTVFKDPNTGVTHVGVHRNTDRSF